MATPTTLSASARKPRGVPRTPAAAGLPDPRPLTEYTAEYSEKGAKSYVTITLAQPCIIRAPQWRFIDCDDGSAILAAAVNIEDNVTIEFEFETIIAASIAFVEVPYQDMEVQNFQGGFVRPGAQWFRAPA